LAWRNSRHLRSQCHYFWWEICRAASKAKWIGSVEAADADAAVEAAAKEFKTDAWRLIALRR
jgi:hypothetical protein